MDVKIAPGIYVAAVSGGVDSMVMLDVLAKLPELKLIVAHYDHGIRPDSGEDCELVRQAAARYGLPFVFDRGNLGPNTSEAAARAARLAFLRRTLQVSGADAILTAHHEDDVIETAVINLLRGTNRRGIAPLHAYTDIERPLLAWTKEQIRAYADSEGLAWREDSTNRDTRYLRNYIRHNIMSKLSAAERRKLLKHIEDTSRLNTDIDRLLIDHLHMHPKAGRLDRHWFIMLPHNVAREVMAGWLRANAITQFDSKLLERLLHGAKTLAPGKRMSVDKSHSITIYKRELALSH